MTNEHGRFAVDAAAASITLSALLGALPHIAAAISVIWGLIRLWETKTVQRAVRCIRQRFGF